MSTLGSDCGGLQRKESDASAADNPGGGVADGGSGERAASEDVRSVARVAPPLSLGKMATVQTGDPALDRLAHAVAIDHLLRTGP